MHPSAVLYNANVALSGLFCHVMRIALARTEHRRAADNDTDAGGFLRALAASLLSALQAFVPQPCDNPAALGVSLLLRLFTDIITNDVSAAERSHKSAASCLTFRTRNRCGQPSKRQRSSSLSRTS
jgi:hypothetical protein